MCSIHPVIRRGWLLGLLLPGVVWAAGLSLPRMPTPQFAPAVSQGDGLTDAEVRAQLESVLPPGTKLMFDPGPVPGSAQGGDAHAPAVPVPVAAALEAYPVIDFSDKEYAPLSSAYVPVMLDWFETLLADVGVSPEEARARGLLTNKVARLMRLFVGIRLTRDGKRSPGLAPAIGWCRIYLKEDWGRFRRGETQALVLLATEQGWHVVDPYTRRMRRLAAEGAPWVIEFIVL
jgi:hypothetical protein